MYANMAKEQLEGAVEGDGDGDGLGGVLSSGARAGPCGNRKQQRIRADLMLTVLYDMLGRYDESDEYLSAAFHVSFFFLFFFSFFFFCIAKEAEHLSRQRKSQLFAGVHSSNQDLICCVKMGVYMGFSLHRGS